jgi:hypothetical protein
MVRSGPKSSSLSSHGYFVLSDPAVKPVGQDDLSLEDSIVDLASAKQSRPPGSGLAASLFGGFFRHNLGASFFAQHAYHFAMLRNGEVGWGLMADGVIEGWWRADRAVRRRAEEL